MKKITIILLAILFIAGCMTQVHKIGSGPQTYEEKTLRQWWVLWGLIPINEIDTHEMAKGAENYEIKTEISFVDGIITIFTSMVTVGCSSVTVTK